MVGRPHNTVRTRLARARQRLRRLTQVQDAEDDGWAPAQLTVSG